VRCLQFLTGWGGGDPAAGAQWRRSAGQQSLNQVRSVRSLHWVRRQAQPCLVPALLCHPRGLLGRPDHRASVMLNAGYTYRSLVTDKGSLLCSSGGVGSSELAASVTANVFSTYVQGGEALGLGKQRVIFVDCDEGRIATVQVPVPRRTSPLPSLPLTLLSMRLCSPGSARAAAEYDVRQVTGPKSTRTRTRSAHSCPCAVSAS
jgi:hypothetical protein